MTTPRSRKSRINSTRANRAKAIAIVIVMLAILTVRWPGPMTALYIICLAATGVHFRYIRPALRPAIQSARRPSANQPAPKAKSDAGQKARDKGWAQPLGRNLVAVSRQCASGQHILCTTTECDCDDCFGHDEEKIMKRNREEYDARFPDEPPF